MTTTVLCPGPSLASRPPGFFAKFDLRVGVNRAAHYIACDWLVAADYLLFKYHPPPGRCRVFTSDETARLLIGRFARLSEFSLTTFSACREVIDPARVEWRSFSFPAALVLARWLGSSRIEVFGRDQTDDADFDGVRVIGCRRDASRWEAERAVVTALVEEFGRRGTEVVCHGRDG